MIKVEVRWQKQVFQDVEIDTSQPASVFKMQLFSLTGVPPDRQKVMGVKGGLLKDDADWTNLGLKEGQKLSMMGTADAVPEAPKEAQKFLEDLPVEQQDTTGLGKYGAGLQNLGNTCYMNSVIQNLYAVPELRQIIKEYTGSDSLTVSLGNLFASLERSALPVPPLEFLLSLRNRAPQFASQSRDGMYMQQDAEECWSVVGTGLKQALPAFEDLFGVQLHTQLKSDETGETLGVDSREYSLKANISLEVNHLHQGLSLGLKSDREQMSSALGRNTVFHGGSKISKLPPNLMVQMVRFFYKADVQQKAKILRKVTFPMMLDVYDLCTNDLKKQLDGPRQKEADDGEEGAKKQKTGELTGRFDLVGVLTHKGRSADSGHYVAWVKQDDGHWIQFDDDEMIPRKEEDVIALSGGGDWHMAYLLLYKGQRC